MKIAFYKGKGKLFNRLIRWYTKSQYSHAELIIRDLGNGYYLGGSSSAMEGGVRMKAIKFSSENWTIVDVPFGNTVDSYHWYCDNGGAKYDWLGVFKQLKFLNKFIKNPSKKSYCNESVAESVGLLDLGTINPQEFFDFCVQHDKDR